MLKGITWGDYILVCGTMLLLYYLVIGIVYFRQELAAKAKALTKRKEPEPENFIASAELAEELISQIKNQIIPQAGSDKTALTSALKQLLKGQGNLNPTLKTGINQVIITAGISTEEVAAIW